MKRSSIGLDEIADWHNLAAAFHRAAAGKRRRPEVRRFAAEWETELAALRQAILAGAPEVGPVVRFEISDPKPRIIHAPCFRERVLHHALMAHCGPVLDRALVDDTYACRVGKGTLAAVQRAQQHARRWSWWAKIDMRAYFASIHHQTLKDLLARKFKHRGLLALFACIIDAHADGPRRGLPIGALTSQQFANFYLGGLDRLLLERSPARGLVRYMDDLVWWGDSRAAVRDALVAAQSYATEQLHLQVKQPVQVGRSRHGVNLCGYRILPDRLLLSRRRKQRYCECRRQWENAFAAGRIDARQLQRGYASALGITLHADAAAWRNQQLRRAPLAPATAAL